MLQSTFRHLPGIGAIREANLWKAGVRTWDDFEQFEREQLPLFGGSRDSEVIAALHASREALSTGNVQFFADRLPPTEHYRIALAFPDRTIFADVESTGLSLYYDTLTLVGWQGLGEYRVLVRGEQRDEMDEAFRTAGVIVTFNGSRFDLPFLRKDYPGIVLPPVHVDLRYFARRVGLFGGQKAVESSLGFRRRRSVKSIKGEAAPVLWHRYRWGDAAALKLLIEYNHADVQGMVEIFRTCARTLAWNTPSAGTEVDSFAVGRRRLRFAKQKGDRDRIYLPPPPPLAAPLATLESLGLASSVRIVGIDLTGSETRPSGWALIEGDRVSTRRIGSDDELVSATLATDATIVSIDSPLSLPVGRSKVGDDDTAREAAGITRACERELRRRGVNVYPCLLPSMQQLTARGILLADRFRKLGVPVIESYPGAAQDILGIPRKRASMEFLAGGLVRFGLLAARPLEEVSHDELDAITSAIVGAFFWAGRFEALGVEEENFLIVPEVSSPELRWRGDRIIGLSGPIAAGKTTAARMLQDIGFSYARYSQVVEKASLLMGIPVSRDSLQAVGQTLNVERGQRWLGQRLLELLPAAGNRVIDGLRHPEDHAFLAETFGPQFIHVHIDAPIAERRERYILRGALGAEFDGAVLHPIERNVGELGKLAHTHIINIGSLANLLERMQRIAMKPHTPAGVC
jgi:uncharacterized protein YprB with RNaseH-like and TPR domain/predicted nuclease with RNAse H fold/dephospho-CoA kinase